MNFGFFNNQDLKEFKLYFPQAEQWLLGRSLRRELESLQKRHNLTPWQETRRTELVQLFEGIAGRESE